MAEISQLQINGTTYDICDATARNSISSNTAAITALQKSISLINQTKKVKFSHWEAGLQIDFVDTSNSGFAIVADVNEISFYKITDGIYAKQHRIAWT